jgi:hypothetical protein
MIAIQKRLLRDVLIVCGAVVLLLLAFKYKTQDNQKPTETLNPMDAVLQKVVKKNAVQRLELTDEVYDQIIESLGGRSDIENLRPLCDVQFNQDAPNEWISISPTNREMKFSVPFNNDWGNTFIKPVVYKERGSEVIEFGPLIAMGEGGCGWGRLYRMETIEYQPVAKVIQDLKGFGTVRGIHSKKLKNAEIVSSISDEFCTVPSVVVIGKQHNYQLSVSCGSDKDIQILEKIAETVEVL